MRDWLRKLLYGETLAQAHQRNRDEMRQAAARIVSLDKARDALIGLAGALNKRSAILDLREAQIAQREREFLVAAAHAQASLIALRESLDIEKAEVPLH